MISACRGVSSQGLGYEGLATLVNILLIGCRLADKISPMSNQYCDGPFYARRHLITNFWIMVSHTTPMGGKQTQSLASVKNAAVTKCCAGFSRRLNE